MNKTVIFDENGGHILNCKPIIYNKKKVIVNPITTPDCSELFWKMENYKIIEIPRSEKLKRLKTNKTKSNWYFYLYYHTEIVIFLLISVSVYLLAKR